MPSELPANHDFVEVCDKADLWDGEMQAFDVGDDEVLVVSLDGVLHPYHGSCPHQNISLVEGTLTGNVLTCRAHLWQFDASTGRGINPATANLIRYPIEVIGGKVRVGNVATTEAGTAPAACTGNCST